MIGNADGKRILQVLDENGIPYIGVGTSQLRELAWKQLDFNPLEPESHALGHHLTV